MNGVGYT